MGDIKLGYNTGYWSAGPPTGALEGVKEAERLGFNSVWTAEAYGSDAQRLRVLAKLGPIVRIVADDERSQLRNRALAEERLAAKLRSALHVPRRRRATRPTRGSQRRRVEAKKQRGETKRFRRPPSADD